MKIFQTNSIILVMIIALFLSGCEQSTNTKDEKPIKIGIMLADYGLGDQSFNDSAFSGLIKAREELGVVFDYRDLTSSKSYKKGLIELIEDEKCDLVIGLGFNMVEDLKAVAKMYPHQQFLCIDQIINADNVASITFKEDEGSYLVGIIAGLKTITNTVGFVGGMDIPLIHKFRDGYIAGVKAVNPKAKVMVDFTDNFGDSQLGRSLAENMIKKNNVDIIYHAAGFSGLGVIEAARKKQIYAIGVDSDQFYIAEKTVITSMLKNVDVAVYTAIKEFVENGTLAGKQKELGILENGVGLAPIRIISLTRDEEKTLQLLKEKLITSRNKDSLNK